MTLLGAFRVKKIKDEKLKFYYFVLKRLFLMFPSIPGVLCNSFIFGVDCQYFLA